MTDVVIEEVHAMEMSVGRDPGIHDIYRFSPRQGRRDKAARRSQIHRPSRRTAVPSTTNV